MITKRLARISIFFMCACSYQGGCSTDPSPQCGDILETFNGVDVRYNDGFNSCESGRHLSPSGYSYGLKWQCVEFVRRYYEQALGHEMPQRWGNADGYFQTGLAHGGLNEDRNLVQYNNGEREKPQVGDLLVFPDWVVGFGHVSIVAEVKNNQVTTVQQNLSTARYVHSLEEKNGRWTIGNDCAGFLRIRPKK
jgi:hypothetical protein